MTLPEIRERIIALAESGFETDEARFDEGYIDNLIHTAAAQVKRIEFMRTKRIHSSWYFGYVPDFNEAAQISTCYYKFKLPQIIALDSRQTGLGYIGSIDCNTAYRVVENRSKFAAYQQHRVMKNRKNTVMISNGYLELYGQAKELLIDGLWFDVTKIPTYNIEKSEYPLESSLVVEIEKIILQTNLALINRTPQDTKQDKKDSTVAANVS